MTRCRLCTPCFTVSMPPPVRAAARIAPSATPGATASSRASAAVVSDDASMPCRASWRRQIAVLTEAGGRRSSNANSMRRRITGLTVRASFMIQIVGTGDFSSTRFRNTFEPSLPRVRDENSGSSARLSSSAASRSSISSNSRIDWRSRASR